MNRRRLTLVRETLAPLASGELESVGGGAFPTLPVQPCLGISWEFTCLDCVTRRTCPVDTGL